MTIFNIDTITLRKFVGLVNMAGGAILILWQLNLFNINYMVINKVSVLNILALALLISGYLLNAERI
jgi:hypothetical protein